MRTLGVMLVVLAIGVVGFGFFRGWFALSSPAGGDEVNINLATDTDKMKDDATAVKDKAAELTGNITDGPAEPPDRASDQEQPTQVRVDNGKPQGVEPDSVRSDQN